MNNTLHLSFFKATREVLKPTLDLQKISKSAITPGEDARGNLATSIGMTGDLTGDILYTFPKETMLEMMRIMTGRMRVNEIDDLTTSTIDEASNIVSSKATVALPEKNVTYDILLPKVIESREGVCAYPANSSTRVNTEIGSVGLETRLQSK